MLDAGTPAQLGELYTIAESQNAVDNILLSTYPDKYIILDYFDVARFITNLAKKGAPKEAVYFSSMPNITIDFFLERCMRKQLIRKE